MHHHDALCARRALPSAGRPLRRPISGSDPTGPADTTGAAGATRATGPADDAGATYAANTAWTTRSPCATYAAGTTRPANATYAANVAWSGPHRQRPQCRRGVVGGRTALPGTEICARPGRPTGPPGGRAKLAGRPPAFPALHRDDAICPRFTLSG
jgi:hypothetical protein